MRILVWQWGRRGAGPRIAVELAEAMRGVPGTEAVLSLSVQAEIMQAAPPPDCALPFPTYENLPGLLRRVAAAPVLVPGLSRRVRALRPDVALCAMTGPLDLLMAGALKLAGVPFLVMVHDAEAHPGDGFPGQMALQGALLWVADGLVALSGHVADRLREQGMVGRRPLLHSTLPPFAFGPPPAAPLAHGGPMRLLSFGRLLPYKGLDLLAEAMQCVGERGDYVLRVVGSGPDSVELERLRGLPGVTVENRWVPEAEVGDLLAWADALVLSHREASQSGVAAAAMTAGRWIIGTAVGGLQEQLRDEPLARLCAPEPEALAAAIVQLLEDPPARVPPRDTHREWYDAAAGLVEQIRQAVPKLAPLRTGVPA